MCLPTSLFTSPSNSNHSFNLHNISCQGPHDHNEHHQYHKAPTGQHHHGVLVREARGPPGRAKARRTLRMNVTIDVITDRVVSSPDFVTDLGSRLLTMSSFSRVPGQVKILNLIKRHVVVKMNCTTTFNISTQAIKEQSCKRKVKL